MQFLLFVHHCKVIKFEELGEQIVLISPKAFEKIKFIEYEIADGTIYNARRMERDNRAKRAYLDNHGADFIISKGNLFVQEFLDLFITSNIATEFARVNVKNILSENE